MRCRIIFPLAICFFILSVLFLSPAHAAVTGYESHTVFVIADLHSMLGGYPLPIYAVNGQLLRFSALLEPANRNGGPIGLAVDAEHEQLFVTYEDSDTLDAIDARSAEIKGQIRLSSTSDLAGIDVLESRDQLFVVDRAQTWVFVYDTVLYQPNDHWYLIDSAGAYGIDVVEDVDGTDVLFVADGTNIVRWYDLDTHEVMGQATLDDNAIGISVDNSGSEPVIFTVAVDPGHDEDFPEDNDYLERYDVATGTVTHRNLDSSGCGISTNPDNGVVYVTVMATGLFAGQGPTVRSYDSTTLTWKGQWELDFCTGNCTPTDVRATTVSYGSRLEKTLTSHPSGLIEIGDDVVFKVSIKNESFFPIHVMPVLDEYDTTQLSFVSATPAPDDANDDGVLDWSDLIAQLGADLDPDDRTSIELHFTALENTCLGQLEGKNHVEMHDAQTADGNFLPTSEAEAPYQLECYHPPVDDTSVDDDMQGNDDDSLPVTDSEGAGWPEGDVTGGCCGCGD